MRDGGKTGVEHVDHGAGDAAARQCRQPRRFVDDTATRHIDAVVADTEHRHRLQRRQLRHQRTRHLGLARGHQAHDPRRQGRKRLRIAGLGVHVHAETRGQGLHGERVEPFQGQDVRQRHG